MIMFRMEDVCCVQSVGLHKNGILGNLNQKIGSEVQTFKITAESRHEEDFFIALIHIFTAWLKQTSSV